MSKKLSLIALLVALAAAVVLDAPRDLVLAAGAPLALALTVWAYGRSFVDWVVAGTHYGA